MRVVSNALGRAMRLRAVRAVGLVAWRVHLLVPTRADVLVSSSRQVAQLYADFGHHRDAASVLASAYGRAGTPQSRVRLAAGRVLAQLDGGAMPSDLEEVLAQVLHEADRHLDLGEIPAAAARLSEALSMGFHTSRHFGATPSPLLTSHEDFMAPFRTSTAAQQLLADPRPRRQAVRTGPTHRLLVLGHDTLSFTDPLVAEYRADGVEVRVVDLATEPLTRDRLGFRDLVQARLEYGLTGARQSLPESLADDVAWADTVFADFGHRALVWASLVRGIEAPLVTRIHRYEALTAMPLLTVWSAVERAVFLTPAIRDVVAATVPDLASRTQVEVIPNRLDLRKQVRPKAPEADRTLALVSWNRMVKDPAWALDVLDVLRADDDRWRLLLIGEEKPSDSLVASQEYHEALIRRIVGLKDAVEVTGFTDDVPAVLQRVGVILSTSRMEGTHESLLQGAASGALPVVRSWPELRTWGGPAALYPAEWVVQSPQAAAARILAAGDPAHDSDDAARAQDWALTHMDWEVARPAFDRVLRQPNSSSEDT